MSWQDTMTKLEVKVKEAQEKEETLNEKTAEFNIAQKEYASVVMEVETLRNELSNTIGSLFQSNPRVKIS